MKKIVLCCLVALLGTAAVASASTAWEASAAKPAKKETKKELVTTIFVTDIDCEGCARKIFNNVPAIGKGIKDLKVDVPTKEVTVTYDPAKTSPEELIKGFAKVKVKAEVKP